MHIHTREARQSSARGRAGRREGRGQGSWSSLALPPLAGRRRRSGSAAGRGVRVVARQAGRAGRRPCACVGCLRSSGTQAMAWGCWRSTSASCGLAEAERDASASPPGRPHARASSGRPVHLRLSALALRPRRPLCAQRLAAALRGWTRAGASGRRVRGGCAGRGDRRRTEQALEVWECVLELSVQEVGVRLRRGERAKRRRPESACRARPRVRGGQSGGSGTHAQRLQLAVRKLVLARRALERVARERVRVLVLLDESARPGTGRESRRSASGRGSTGGLRAGATHSSTVG